nr:hypothetical protein [Tanacetum cinerariifolium]
TKDLDAYDSNCDDLSSAKVLLMVNLSSCDSYVLSETKNAKLEAFKQEIDTLKETLSNNVKEKESLSTTLNIFKTESKEKESKYIDKEIVLKKQNKELENTICMSFEEVEAKFKTVWEQIEGGVSKISEGEAAWLKRKGIRSECDVQAMMYSEQPHIVNSTDNEIILFLTLNICKKTQDAGIQDTNLSAPNDLLILSLVEQMTDQVANLDKEKTNKMTKNAKLEAFKQEIDTLKETLSNNVKEKESLSTTLNIFKTESKEKESKSKPSGNTKNNRISQTSSSNKTNNVEDQSRSIKSRKNKKNHVEKFECNTDVMQSVLDENSVFESISNVLIKHSVKNAMSESLCAISNKCLFDANHDMCLIDYVNDMNVRSKAKSKKNKKRKV